MQTFYSWFYVCFFLGNIRHFSVIPYWQFGLLSMLVCSSLSVFYLGRRCLHYFIHFFVCCLTSTGMEKQVYYWFDDDVDDDDDVAFAELIFNMTPICVNNLKHIYCYCILHYIECMLREARNILLHICRCRMFCIKIVMIAYRNHRRYCSV